MNTQKRNRLADPEIKLMAVRGQGAGELGDKGEGIKKYRLIVTE